MCQKMAIHNISPILSIHENTKINKMRKSQNMKTPKIDQKCVILGGV